MLRHVIEMLVCTAVLSWVGGFLAGAMFAINDPKRASRWIGYDPHKKSLWCEVESVSDKELVCWVRINREQTVRTAFPAAAYPVKAVAGQELIWDQTTDRLRNPDWSKDLAP